MDGAVAIHTRNMCQKAILARGFLVAVLVIHWNRVCTGIEHVIRNTDESASIDSVGHLSTGGTRTLKLVGCRTQNLEPRAKLNISAADFAFGLLDFEVPRSCGNLEFSTFRRCSRDTGQQRGCCTSDCTRMLQGIQGQCWNDIQRILCRQASPQMAIMMDLLMRRCDEGKREVFCTKSCEDQTVEPKGELKISPFKFGLDVSSVPIPGACLTFAWADLETCSADLGQQHGCCNKKCIATVSKLEDGCLSALTEELCKGPSNQTAIMMDLLAQRCDPDKRAMACPLVFQCERDGTCKEDNKRLLVAAKTGNLLEVQRLLARGANTDTRDADGVASLDWASFGGHLAVVKALISAGANVMAINNGGWTPLDSAALKGHVDVVKMLIEAGADVNAAAKNGATPLHSASVDGHIEVVRTLIEAGAAVNIAANKGVTPLHNAAYNGHAEVTEILVSAGADVQATTHVGTTPLQSAAAQGHAGVIEVLAASGADVHGHTTSGWTPLQWAAYHGHVEALQALISSGAGVSARTLHPYNGVPADSTALHVSARQGHVRVVQVLVQYGANKAAVDSEDHTARDVVPIDDEDRTHLLTLLS